MSLTVEKAWDDLHAAYQALGETFNARFGKSRDPRACLAKYNKVQTDDGCDLPDCPLCDALEFIADLQRDLYKED